VAALVLPDRVVLVLAGPQDLEPRVQGGDHPAECVGHRVHPLQVLGGRFELPQVTQGERAMGVGWTSLAGDAKVSAAKAPSGTSATPDAVRNVSWSATLRLGAYRRGNAGVTAWPLRRSR
jgi:hypothetical protein